MNLKTKNNLMSLEDIVDQHYGEKGSSSRDEFEKGYIDFKLGHLIHQARIKKGMTQQQLADKCGTNKGYISKIENDIKEVRLSTLKRIVEIGLEGQLEVSIKL